jgi:hypothetical protein
MARTDVFRNAVGLPAILRPLLPLLQTLLANSPEAAAETPVFLAQDERAVGTGGKFYGPKAKERAIPERAARPERRGMLWAASEALVRPHLADAASHRFPTTHPVDVSQP